MRIELVSLDDWVDVFKDGEHVWGNHSIPPDMLLDALGLEYTVYEMTQEEFEDENFPDFTPYYIRQHAGTTA